ncbi:hypothetical protein N656DRAFT_499189 [Canariomyces notabilis]|uniref:Uncharacterized protein n=1 Tax=Canariomyces notabilis TaxID=2074819 RepID=A0AAN6TJ47_9PEZI|nr:hypothetical protein N656DRAFT_499189 [Canariomyces arenarius]
MRRRQSCSEHFPSHGQALRKERALSRAGSPGSLETGLAERRRVVRRAPDKPVIILLGGGGSTSFFCAHHCAVILTRSSAHPRRVMPISATGKANTRKRAAAIRWCFENALKNTSHCAFVIDCRRGSSATRAVATDRQPQTVVARLPDQARFGCGLVGRVSAGAGCLAWRWSYGTIRTDGLVALH